MSGHAGRLVSTVETRCFFTAFQGSGLDIRAQGFGVLSFWGFRGFGPGASELRETILWCTAAAMFGVG